MPPTRNDIIARALLLTTLVALSLLPAGARADDLGGLVFVVIVWPLGAILFISLTVLGIIGLSKRKKEKPTPADRTFGKWLVGTSLAEAVFYLIAVLLVTGKWFSRAPELTVISLAPLLVLATLCLFLGRALIRKGKNPRK